LTSTTGISALLVGGRTIHSWSGLGLFDPTKDPSTYIDKIKKKKFLVNQWKNTRVLIIDEISMMHPAMLDCLNAIGKAIRGSNAPMGGIQTILVGDFYQLPPIITEDKPKIEFCFETNAWANLDLETIEFTKIYRQSEKQLMDVLNKIRVGKADSNVIKYLKRLTTNPNYNKNYTHVFPTKRKVADYNNQMLAEIEEPEKRFKAIVTFDEKYNKEFFKFPKDTLIEEELVIKKGCFVMCIFNLDFDQKVVNGSQGVITGFQEKSGHPIVQFDSGTLMTIQPYVWEMDGYSISQYPLMVAYSVTVHKIQGSSIEKLSIDIGKNIFETGQSYVALSRCTNSAYLHISHLAPEKILANDKVVKFYKDIASQPQEIIQEAIY
jgi:ATP-dependent DNA helicase PIF1